MLVIIFGFLLVCATTFFVATMTSYGFDSIFESDSRWLDGFNNARSWS